MTTLIYTAIFSDYDLLKQPAAQDADCAFVCFTDQHMPDKVGAWTIVRVPTLSGVHPRMQAKRYKVMSQDLGRSDGTAAAPGLPPIEGPIDLSIWMDASMAIKSPAFADDMRARLGDGDWAMFVHPDRDCIYDEAVAINALPKFKTLPVFDQVDAYRGVVPEHAGLLACGVIVRREPSPDRIADAQRLWWSELLKRTFRDQLSLPYVLALYPDCKPTPIHDPLRRNDWFDIIPHIGTG